MTLAGRSDSDRILVLTTGGTIDKQYFDALSKYQITNTVVAKMLAIARVTHPHRVEEVLRKDSLELTDKDRETLVQRVRDAPFSRVVITHGTDTMSQTGHALAAIPNKTIVLTGALAPARFSESDASFNLGMAFAVAQMAPVGVYIAMNGTVFPAEEARKDRELGFVRQTS